MEKDIWGFFVETVSVVLALISELIEHIKGMKQ